MPFDDGTTSTSNLDRLAEQVDELVHIVEQHHNNAEQLALEIQRLRDSVAVRQQKMVRLETVLVQWRGRLAASGDAVGSEQRRLAEERLQRLEEALHTTRVLMEETELKVNQLSGQQQRQQANGGQH